MKYLYKVSSFIAVIFLIVTSYILYQRIGAFGCFDECPNYAVGYFLSLGRKLYSDIFFNHQPLLPVISYLLQHVGNPQSLYELVRLHRTFVIVFSLLMNILLIWRFGWVGIGFSFLYESTKFYSMGSLFLGESLSVYLYVYVFLVTCGRWMGRPHKKIDGILVPCMIWAGIFLREPYIPLASFLFLSYLFVAKKQIKLSLVIFLCLTSITLWQLPLGDYWFNVVIANAQTMLSQEMEKVGIGGVGIIKPFIYPLLVWFSGTSNLYLWVERSVSFGVLLFGFILAWRRKKYRLSLIWVVVVLGLAAIRYVFPGTMYYEAFHLLPWWGLMIATAILFAREIWGIYKERGQRLWVVFYFIVVSLIIFSPKSFYWERFDTKAEFATGYARYSINSEAIKAISNPTDTIFLEVWDDILYVTTKLQPAYEFSWYIPIMSSYGKYVNARAAMFVSNPPDFYYFSCENKEDAVPISTKEQTLYTRLQKDEVLSCIFVRKSVFKRIKKEKRDALSRLGFSIPE